LTLPRFSNFIAFCHFWWRREQSSMTVCVGVAVHDCLVFAADSASTLITTDLNTGQSDKQSRLPVIATE
jgi:hypothetical protein